MIAEYKKSIGKKLKEKRLEDPSMTYYRIQKYTGLNCNQVKDIEAGSSRYSIDSFLKYIFVLGLDIDIGDVVNAWWAKG